MKMSAEQLQSAVMGDIMRLTIATRIEEARSGRGEDRIAVVESSNRRLIVVADGADGIAGGANAAEAICGALTDDAID